MNEHAEHWIDAYLDGELTPAGRQQAETHLAGCQECRRLLAQRRSLANLLQEAPGAKRLKSGPQFIAEINLRLPRQQNPPRPSLRALHVGWYLVPVTLLTALAFIEAVFVLSTSLLVFPGIKETLANGIAILPALPVRLPGLLGDWLGWMGFFNLFDWNLLTSLAALAIIGLLYLGWLASWWARNRKNQTVTDM
jgi:anti-sigma factor RsiW